MPGRKLLDVLKVLAEHKENWVSAKFVHSRLERSSINGTRGTGKILTGIGLPRKGSLTAPKMYFVDPLLFDESARKLFLMRKSIKTQV